MKLFRQLRPVTLGFVSLAVVACSSEQDNARPIGNSNPGGGESGGGSGGGGGGTSGGGGGSSGGSSTGGPKVSTNTDGEGVIVGDPNSGGSLGSGGGTPTPGCGDGMLTADEACDDGNKVDKDGCEGTCRQQTPGFSCAEPGKPCRPIASCGDGIVAPSEQCDDKNVVEGDGCSARCRVEFGKKCEGEPSKCTETKCGDGKKEGAEGCDDGNTNPFDGCSSICLREPNCTGPSCISECGDGLVINEDCDDGNTTDGDGCSSTCKKESGFACTQATTCEKVNGACVLRVPAIFRDFPQTHSDFDIACDGVVTGVPKDTLDAKGRPVLNGTTNAKACIKDAASYAQWYTDGDWNARLNSSLVLFDNGMGGFVNRYDAMGAKWTATVDPKAKTTGSAGTTAGTAMMPATTPPGTATTGGEQSVNGTCDKGCTERTRNSLQCDNECRPKHDAIRIAEDALRQLEQQITQAQMQAAQQSMDLDAGAGLTTQQAAQLEAAEAKVTAATEGATKCDADCKTRSDGLIAACVMDCKACSYDKTKNCTGGLLKEFEGNPLFFPVDSVKGKTADSLAAKIPEEYGYTGWPDEKTVFPGAPNHNFGFTTEVQYWFRYDKTTNAKLDFLGDDDVWVFINNKLAVDIGGAHVPTSGTVTINAASAAKFGLTDGGVFKITVFHAERKPAGSSFKLTLSGFQSTPSDCQADCGDGVVSFGEECDDGKNDGGYNECAPGCKLGPYCGNGIKEEGESCDNGPGGGAGCPACRNLLVF